MDRSIRLWFLDDRTNQRDDIFLKVILHLEYVYKQLVLQGGTEEMCVVWYADYIFVYSVFACHYEGFVFQEWDILDRPVFSLSLPVPLPLILCKEYIFVFYAEIFTEEAGDLGLGSEVEVSNYYSVLVLYLLWDHWVVHNFWVRHMLIVRNLIKFDKIRLY